MRLLYGFLGYAYKHGFGDATRKALDIVWSMIRVPLNGLVRRRGRYVIVSHQLDRSGAPHIALGIVEDFARHVGPSAIRLVTFEPVSEENVERIRKQSIKVDIYPHGLAGLVRVHHRDFVLMNSTAIPSPFLDHILARAERGQLAALHWYAHEEEPERWFNPAIEERVRKLLAVRRLALWVGGLKASRNYLRYFGESPQIRYLAYRLELDEALWTQKQSEEFATLRFQMSATIRDCGKGQFGVLQAFQELLSRKLPANFRPFEVHFNGIEEGTVSARHLVDCGHAVLGDRFKHGGRTPRLAESFARSKACQVVICYSVTECFSLAVIEGMAMGQVVLRNGCSGIDEQLREGENGFYVESGNPKQFADVLERLLDPGELSNEDLWRMGLKSQEMARAFTKLDYFDRIMNPGELRGA